MVVIFHDNASVLKARVIGAHMMPELLTDEEKSKGVEIPEYLEEEKVQGKMAVPYINLETKEMFYEYVDRPLTMDEKIQLMEDKGKSANQKYAELDKTTATFDELKTAKMAALDESCSYAIVSGFDYVVDGVSYHFSCSLAAQANFTGTESRFAKGKITEVEWTVVNNETGNEQRIILDELTFNEIADFVFEHVDSNVKRLRNDLQPQVELADEETIDSIVW